MVSLAGILSNFFEPQLGHIGQALTFSIDIFDTCAISVCLRVYFIVKLIQYMTGSIEFTEDEDQNLESIFRIGLLHVNRGKPRDAIFYFDRVLIVEPEHLNALIYKGNALGKLGKYEEAISIYNKVLAIKPDHSTCLLNKGLALHYLKKYQDAISCYNVILSHVPDDASALYHKACSMALEEKKDDALQLLEKAIMLDSRYVKRASGDMDFVHLRADHRFQSLIS
jgi:tetratricopeptide (TPR) repeat protein